MQITAKGNTDRITEFRYLSAGANQIKISNSILNGNKHAGIRLDDGVEKIIVWNNLIYNCGDGIYNMQPTGSLIYNNTFTNNTYGLYYGGGIVLKNNLFYGNTTADIGNTSAFLAGTDYNATNRASIGYTVTGSGNTHDRVSQTISMVDPTHGDLHLSNSDTSARGLGANLTNDSNLPFITDIDGQVRPATGSVYGWDIGADQSEKPIRVTAQ